MRRSRFIEESPIPRNESRYLTRRAKIMLMLGSGVGVIALVVLGYKVGKASNDEPKETVTNASQYVDKSISEFLAVGGAAETCGRLVLQRALLDQPDHLVEEELTQTFGQICNEETEQFNAEQAVDKWEELQTTRQDLLAAKEKSTYDGIDKLTFIFMSAAGIPVGVAACVGFYMRMID